MGGGRREEVRTGGADVDTDRNRFKDRGERHTERNSSFDPIGQISVCLSNKYKSLQKTGVYYCREHWSCRRKGPSVGQTSTYTTSCFC